MNDIDELLRNFRSTLDEPPPGALARARSRVLTQATRAASARSRPRWIAIPATAVGVTAVAVTASLVLGQSPPLGTEPTAAPATSVTTTPTPPTTAELIEAWARDLETGPPPPAVAPGQLILLSSRLFANGRWADQPPGGTTIEREGLLVVDHAEHGDLDSYQQYVAQQRTEFAQLGPSWRYPTTEWLEALDPSPTSLRQACGDLCYNDRSTWNAIKEQLARGEVVLPPRIRAGLLRLLGTLDGVTAYEATVDGRLVRVISWPDTFEPRPGIKLLYYRSELYIDPTLNRFVGSGTLMVGRSPDQPQCVATGNANNPTPRPYPTGDECFAVIPLDEPERVTFTLWEQTLVTP